MQEIVNSSKQEVFKMPRGQKRSNREIRKPKQDKSKAKVTSNEVVAGRFPTPANDLVKTKRH
ncbi:hypothetical protein F9K97_22885 [Brucella anthropi]|nr:hypothetical protein F9K97_22885 [Brucella anthropi]